MDIKPSLELLEKYSQELSDFCQVDEFNVKEKQMKAPLMKHLFVGRLIRHKMLGGKLRSEKEKLVNKLAQKAIEESPVKLDSRKIADAANKNDLVVDINNQIYYNSQIIEYLEKVERILSSFTYDVKNIVEIMKLETT